MKSSSRVEGMFRQVTPLILLGVLLALVFEAWLPGAGWLKQQLGDQVILRSCIVVLVLYVLILWGETLRLHSILTGVLEAFRQFNQSGAAPTRAEGAGRNPRARLEAARLLIAALGSPDASIRATSRHNLARLVGQDLGDEPAPWLAWLQQQETGGAS